MIAALKGIYYLILYSIIIYGVLKFLFTKKHGTYHSNWGTLIDKLEYSSEEFYEQLKQKLLDHNISGMNFSNVTHHQGVEVMSGSRTYLRVTYKDYYYDICAAPFGNGFFISWWLFRSINNTHQMINRIPYVGKFIADGLYPDTYYSVDTASMFMSYAQQSVLDIIDEITNAKGLKALSEQQRQPKLNDFFNRKINS